MSPGTSRVPGRPRASRVRKRSGLRAILRSPAGRITNQTLLVALVLVFGTGVATVAIGSASGRWAAIAHGIAGLMILLLVPWKSRVVKGGLRRGRHTRRVSLVLAALVVITFVAGLGYATGLVPSIAGKPGLWVHIAVALVLVPLLLWHIVARRIRPRRSDLLHGEVSYGARCRSWRIAAVRVPRSQSLGCSLPLTVIASLPPQPPA